MQVTLIAALVGLAAADLATIQASLQSVQDSLNQLDTSVQALDANNLQSAPPVLTMSQMVQQTIDQAAQDIQATDELGLTDALALQDSADGLTTTVQNTVNDLVAQKPALDQLGTTQVAVMSLQSQQQSSATLGDAIVSKVPAIGQGIAQDSIDQINDAINNGITQLGGTAAAAPAPQAAAANGTAVVGQPADGEDTTMSSVETSAAGKRQTAAGSVPVVGAALQWGSVALAAAYLL